MTPDEDIDPNVDPKVKSVRYTSDGMSVIWGEEITAEEKKAVEDRFNSGVTDPVKLREVASNVGGSSDE